jgi:hypothetical protein
MKKILKWAGIIVGSLIVVAFFLFLYFIPPFTIAPPEEFIKPNLAQGPSMDEITDPVQRLLAERGRYIMVTTDCNGCHTTIGDKGPKYDTEYLAGGAKGYYSNDGLETYCRNLTPDAQTGLARRTDDEVKRVLRSGVLPEGRQAYWRRMPWNFFANWTEEDRHAVLTYLRHIKPVYHGIPEAKPHTGTEDPKANEEAFGGDEAKHAGAK